MKKFLLVLGGFLCAITCIVLFALEISFIAFTSAKTLLEKNTIEDIVSESDIKKIIQNSPTKTSDMYGLFDSLGFSVEETDEILSSKAFEEFINTYLYDNITNFITDKDLDFNYESIKQLVEDIEIEKHIKFENKDEFLNLVREKYPEIKTSIDISNNVKNNLTEEQKNILKFVISDALRTALIVILVIIYLFMCLFRWSFYKPLIWYGITTSFASFIMLQIFISFTGVQHIIINEVDLSLSNVTAPILRNMRNRGILVSLIILAIGIIMIAGYVLINKKVKLKKQSESSEFLERGPDTL